MQKALAWVLRGLVGWAKKNKSVKIYSASILCGALLHKDYWNIFIFSQKIGYKGLSRGRLCVCN